MDPANWCDTAQELQSLEFLAKHFEVTLANAGFNQTRLRTEWRDLKRIVTFFYRGVNSVCCERRSCFIDVQNLQTSVCWLKLFCVLAGPSNSIVEKCFSQLSAMLSDPRLSLGPDVMEDLLQSKQTIYPGMNKSGMRSLTWLLNIL